MESSKDNQLTSDDDNEETYGVRPLLHNFYEDGASLSCYKENHHGDEEKQLLLAASPVSPSPRRGSRYSEARSALTSPENESVLSTCGYHRLWQSLLWGGIAIATAGVVLILVGFLTINPPGSAAGEKTVNTGGIERAYHINPSTFPYANALVACKISGMVLFGVGGALLICYMLVSRKNRAFSLGRRESVAPAGAEGRGSYPAIGASTTSARSVSLPGIGRGNVTNSARCVSLPGIGQGNVPATKCVRAVQPQRSIDEASNILGP